ncbi:MAG TPA: hypothetical protein VHS09_00305 [Polyangiaceae bacterium]|nr:hypothetical protein [Polyangiaceae bacterium]
MDEKNMKTVWTITERTSNGATKSFWTKVGVGFVNRDGSISLRLDCIPISGALQVREWEPAERRQDPNGAEAPPRPRPRAATPAPADDALI